MPIEREKFEKKSEKTLGIERGSQSDRVLKFLGENPDKAFTLDEVEEGTDVERSSVSVVLSRLENKGLVRHKGKYWTVADDERVRGYVKRDEGTDSSSIRRLALL